MGARSAPLTRSVAGSVNCGLALGEEVPARAEHAVAQECLAPEAVDAEAVADLGRAGHVDPDLAAATAVRDKPDQAAEARLGHAVEAREANHVPGPRPAVALWVLGGPGYQRRVGQPRGVVEDGVVAAEDPSVALELRHLGKEGGALIRSALSTTFKTSAAKRRVRSRGGCLPMARRLNGWLKKT